MHGVAGVCTDPFYHPNRPLLHNIRMGLQEGSPGGVWLLTQHEAGMQWALPAAALQLAKLPCSSARLHVPSREPQILCSLDGKSSP